MKKIILSLIAVMTTMSINAQVVKVYDNGTLVDTYTNSSTNTVEVVFEEIPTTGEAAVSSSAGIDGNKVEWVQLWKDGPKWAVFNVGAKSASESGGHYQFGTSDENASFEFSLYYSDIQNTSYDTAKNLWGNKWLMPTKTDYDDLIANCNLEWTTQNGLQGMLFTGKGRYSSNSLFFPAAGYKDDGTIKRSGDCCQYWSSTVKSDEVVKSAYCLYYFCYNGNAAQYASKDYRGYGFCVRAILNEK